MRVRRRRRPSVTPRATRTAGEQRRQPARAAWRTVAGRVSASTRCRLAGGAVFGATLCSSGATWRCTTAAPAAKTYMSHQRCAAAPHRHTGRLRQYLRGARGARAPASSALSRLCFAAAWCPAATAAHVHTCRAAIAPATARAFSSFQRGRSTTARRAARRARCSTHLLAFKKTAAVAHLRT